MRGYTGSGGLGFTGSIGTGFVGSKGDAGFTGSSASGAGLGARAVLTTATTSIANGATTTTALTGYKTYVLSKVATNAASWVRIYSDTTSRSNDSTRLVGNDPLPGSGVIAEVITTSGSLTQLITPGVVGFNNDATTSTAVYLAVTNNSGATQAVSVSLTLLQLEQ